MTPRGPLRIRALVAGVSLAVAVGITGAVALWKRPQVVPPMTPEQLRAALFAELQPVELANCRLERLGEPNDGGYLMCANLLGSVKAGYSYGISGYDQWGCDIARRLSVRVHQYDCFNLERPVCADGLTVFHAECVAPSRKVDDEERIFGTFESQFASNGDGAKRVVVKIDVEGAEWQTLLDAPGPVLNRIDQLVVEFHGVDRGHHLAAVRRLKQFFVVGHLHMNNYACSPGLDPFPAWAYEVLFVNRRLAVVGGPRAAGPHPLDAPNKPGVADCQLIPHPSSLILNPQFIPNPQSNPQSNLQSIHNPQCSRPVECPYALIRAALRSGRDARGTSAHCTWVAASRAVGACAPFSER